MRRGSTAVAAENANGIESGPDDAWFMVVPLVADARAGYDGRVRRTRLLWLASHVTRRYICTMPAKPKPSRPKTSRERMQARRARLRAQGLRPVQFWVPDLRDPKVLAEIKREGALLSKHPDNDAIDTWIEAVYDFDEIS